MTQRGNGAPSYGVPLDISGGPVRVPSSSRLRFSVQTAGAVVVTYRNTPGVECTLDFPEPGVYTEDGEFGTIDYAAGSALVLLPADTITVLNA